jgi:virginiamycin B lyase
MRSISKVVGFLGWAVFLASVSHAGTIAGTVKGPDGAPFEGAFVQAQNTKTQITVSVLSDKEGRYRVENLPAGEYDIRVKAIGYKSDPRSGVSLGADQNASFEFALQNGMVHWNDLSLYQGKELLPEAKGKETLLGICSACHGFETRIASVTHDESGWRDAVKDMVTSMHFFLSSVGRFNDQNQIDVVSYLTSEFGPDSTLPRSPADLPKYQQLKLGPFSDEAMKIVYVEYQLPGLNRMPWSAAPDHQGNFWMPYYGAANKIGRLNPKSGEVQEFAVPNRGTAGIHSVVPASDGSMWFSEQGANKIGKWDPTTQKITEYQDAYAPGKEGTMLGGSKHTLRIEPNGEIWATGGPLSRFDPKTGKFTGISEVPSAYGIALDQGGDVWFAEFTPDGRIGKVDPKTLKVKKWDPPTPHSWPRRIQVDSDGMVWFAEYQGGKIARFDPKTEAFKEYALPGADPTPYALGIGKDHSIWYSSDHMDVIGRLDPITGHVTQYPFPQSENTMREFFLDSQGRMWFASPSNNIVGYFFLAGADERASK